MPYFLVVAGPNGAGKSTFSRRLSRPGALIFDPDEQRIKLEKQFSDISHEALETALTDKYRKFELRAIGSMQHLTVETNLRNEFLAERADFFKGIGYETRLIYMLLPSITASMDRVNLRVKQKGHFVDAESIQMNFIHGLENLRKYASNFDQIIILSAENIKNQRTQPQLLLTIKNKEITYRNSNSPEWTKEIIRGVEEATTDHRLSRGRGR